MNGGAYGPGDSTTDRLTAALHARTATLQEDTLTTRAPAYPTGSATREPLLPRWGWAAAALAVVASVLAGVLLGTQTHSTSTSAAALPPARTQTVDDGIQGQAKITLLAVRGPTIRLEVDLKNLAAAGSNDSWSLNSSLGRASGDYDLSGTTLTIDGLEIHPNVLGNGDCQCTSTSGSIGPQEALSVYAVFAAPRTLPKTADVYVKGFGSWLDVPVSR